MSSVYSQEAVHFVAPTKSPVKDEAEAQQAPGMYQDLQGMDQNSTEREGYELSFSCQIYFGWCSTINWAIPGKIQ